MDMVKKSIKRWETPKKYTVQKSVCGVYLIYFKNNHLYIGSSGHLRPRISNHVSKFKKYIEYIKYIECNDRFELKKLEKEYIEKYNPDMNDILAIPHKAIIKLLN